MLDMLLQVEAAGLSEQTMSIGKMAPIAPLVQGHLAVSEKQGRVLDWLLHRLHAG